jgi:mono/diheme cytochrome c family protein
MDTRAILVLAFSLAACGGAEADLGACPPNSDAQQLAGRKVVEDSCNVCHASNLTGVSRRGAPEGIDFDNLATVRAEAGEMYGLALEGEMPELPYDPLSESDLESMRVWLACGAKDVQ